MKYIAYCIFCSSTQQNKEILEGVGGRRVVLVSKNGLSCAASTWTYSEVAPDISQILAYEKVVEGFHRRRTIIPLRYGCLFEGRSQIVHLLEERNKHYKALLQELNGCVEMGLRVLFEEQKVDQVHATTQGPYLPGHGRCCSQPGRAYLALKRASYEQEGLVAKKGRMVVEQCRDAFAGLFVKWKMENSTSCFPLISLYFLVPTASVEPFRKVFRSLSLRQSSKILMSGPWPPYNFVVVDRVEDQSMTDGQCTGTQEGQQRKRGIL